MGRDAQWTSISPAGRRSSPAQAKGSGSLSRPASQPPARRLPLSRAGGKRSITQSRLSRRGGGARVAAIQADVAVAADLRRAYDEAMTQFGKIDIVVNNAGTSRTGAFQEITDEVWREDFDQKLF